MMKCAAVCAALVAGMCCAADEGAAQAKPPKGKKPNVLELVRPFDVLVGRAEALYMDGDAKEALEAYREALENLTELEMKYYEWVTLPEFAPVRSRRVHCEKTMDRIMLEEAQVNARTMTVTDTRELEKKREERKRAAAEADAEVLAPVKLGSKGGTGEAVANDDADADKLLDEETFGIDDELETVKDLIQLERFDEAARPLVKVLRIAPENREARFLMALVRVRQGRSSDALVSLEDLLADDAMDEPTLLLAAGAYMATGAYSKAVDALDRAMKANPKRPDALINMTWLLLEMRPNDTAAAERYYRLAVEKGATRVREIERKLGIRQD